MDPVLGAGIIGGVSSLVGSGLNVIGANSTNRTNKEIAEMNNKTMIRLMREQTKIEQDFNSIGSQMKRAMAAGINPMLLAGAQPTSASASSVPSLDSPVMQNPFNAVDLGGSSMMNAMIQTESLKNQSKALDIQDFESTTELLRVVGDLAKSGNLTSSDINDLISKFVRPDRQNTIGSLVHDQWIIKRVANSIELSDLDVKERKYLFDWLDEFTNAEYTMMLADIEYKQTSSNLNRSNVRLNRSQERVNASIAALNEAKRKEVKQAIKNMEEQWKTLNFQGELDAKKLLRVAEIADNAVNKIVHETKVSKKEANSYLWRTSIMPFLQTIIGAGGYVAGKVLD